jgi:hypothetical protein
MVDLVDDPPSGDSHPKQTAATGEGLDLSGRGIIGEITQGAAHPLADHRIKCLVLLAGTRGQFDLIGGHPRLTFGKLSVNVSQPVSAPVVGFPFGERFFPGGEVGGLFQGLDSGDPGSGDARGHDRGDSSALRVGKVNYLAPLGRLVGSTGQRGGVIDRQLGHMISIGPAEMDDQAGTSSLAAARHRVRSSSSHQDRSSSAVIRWGPFGDHTPCTGPNNPQVATSHANLAECR